MAARDMHPDESGYQIVHAIQFQGVDCLFNQVVVYLNTTLPDRCQYNGKELEKDMGINLYDYGARWYDAAVGRWTSVDPLAEKYAGWSTYHYTMDNPVLLVDPDGRKVETIFKDENGNVLHETNDGNNNVVIISNEYVEAFKESVSSHYASIKGEPSIESEKAFAQSLFDVFAAKGQSLSKVYQLGFTANATLGFGTAISFGVAWDTQGNWDFYFSGGPSLGADFSGGGELTVNSSNEFISVKDLKGFSVMDNFGMEELSYGVGGDFNGGKGGDFKSFYSRPFGGSGLKYSSNSIGISPKSWSAGYTRTLEHTILFRN